VSHIEQTWAIHAPIFRTVVRHAGGAASEITNGSLIITKEITMKSGTEDRAKGTFHEIKGKAKEAVGIVTNSPDMEIEGTVEKNAGKVQKKIGQIKKVFGK
jgi:uncharacterized protein YjbJ (UPF0337 family)